MSSIREQLVALDSNEFIFAFRRGGRVAPCFTLVHAFFDGIRGVIPHEIHVELQRNLSAEELADLFGLLKGQHSVRIDYDQAEDTRISYWRSRGAKKGDAVIIAQLERLGVTLFISENRHFLLEIPDLPFEVITAQQALERLS